MPAESLASDPRLEDYLDHVGARLVGRVPYARRQELRAELRAHLEALAATQVERGSTRDAAVVKALRQFGPPECLAREWVREWMQGTAPARVPPAWRAMGTALGSFGLMTLAGALLLGPFTVDVLGPLLGYPGEYLNIERLLEVVFLLFPLLAGLTTGLLAPARHVLGTFYALAALIAASVAWMMAAPPPAGQDAPITSVGLLLALVQAFYWMPVGCAGAALGGAIRAWLSLRPGRWVLQ